MIPPDSNWDLNHLPVLRDPGGPYYRIHLVGEEAAKFENSGLYRFDPPPRRREDFGTCYMAASPEGAFLQTLGGIRPLSERHVDERVLAEMSGPSGLQIADFVDEPSVTVSSTWIYTSMLDDYSVSQRWAEMLHDSGFDGVQYLAGHYPHQYRAIALWSAPGTGMGLLKADREEPIPCWLIDQLEESSAIELLREVAIAMTEDPEPEPEPEDTAQPESDT
jgi:hypothetical protein